MVYRQFSRLSIFFYLLMIKVRSIAGSLSGESLFCWILTVKFCRTILTLPFSTSPRTLPPSRHIGEGENIILYNKKWLNFRIYEMKYVLYEILYRVVMINS